MIYRIVAMLLIACVPIPAALASGHGEAVAADAPVELSVTALRGPTGVGVAPYLGDGSFSTMSAELRFDVVADPPTMIARLVSGETDIGMLPSNVVAQLYNRGVPVQIAAVSLWGLLYVVGDDPAINAWEDLAGRTVHSVGQGATPDILARHLSERNGIDPDTDLELSFRYPPTELAQLMVAGEIDLALVPEPFVTQVTSRRSELGVLIDLQAEWARFYGGRYPQTVLVVRSDAAREHPAAVSEALALVEQGWRDMVADPAVAGELVAASALGLPGPVVERAIPRFNAEYVDAREAQDALNQYFAVLFEANPRSVGGAVPDSGIFLDLGE